MEKGELIYEDKVGRELDNNRFRQDPGRVEEACHQAQQRMCAA